MGLNELLVLIYFVTFMVFLLSGYPVGLVLGGLGFLFAFLGDILNVFGIEVDVTLKLFHLAVGRFFSAMTNINLVPVPLFIFMGIMLDRSGVATKLLQSLQLLFRKIPGGLALAVTLIGVILAATTGIIGASVVLLGTIALPQMLKSNYKRELALGTVVASGTLGILIPPSIMLLVMADQMMLSVPDLFMAAMIPGFLLASLYMLYIIVFTLVKPDYAPVAGHLKAEGEGNSTGSIMQIYVYLFAILVAVCLQTSFLTPPMGPALFYVQGIAPPGVRIQHIYRGVIPYVFLQLLAIVMLIKYPSIVTWLPTVFGR